MVTGERVRTEERQEEGERKDWTIWTILKYVNLFEEAWRIGIGILKVVVKEESTWNSEACLRSQLAGCQALQ